jgi:hypothetical protein
MNGWQAGPHGSVSPLKPREQEMWELEQALTDRYPGARIAVTGEGGGVSVAIDQPNDSVRLKVDMESAVLVRILGRAGDPCGT